jgi:TusA-related sulfurtransferase
MERLELQGLVCPYRSAATKKQLARMAGRKKQRLTTNEPV